MLRRIFQFALLAALVLGTAILLVGSCNPWRLLYGLEPSRIAPRMPFHLPKTPLVAGANNYLLLPKYENSPFALEIHLPFEYVLPPNRFEKLAVTYSFSTSMYYPEMTGATNPKNERLRNCVGYCEGYISTLVKAVEPSNEGNKRTLARLYADRDAHKPAVVYEALEPLYGFDEHFVFTYPMQTPPGRHEFFVKKVNGDPKLIFQCSPSAPSPACSAYVASPTTPEIEVWVNFGMHLLPEWQKILQSMDRKIGEWFSRKHDLSKQAGGAPKTSNIVYGLPRKARRLIDRNGGGSACRRISGI